MLTSKILQITGSSENLQHVISSFILQFTEHTCAKLLEYDNFLSHIVFTDDAVMPVGITVSSAAVNIQNMKGLLLELTGGERWRVNETSARFSLLS
jgi:hypothetical protein